MTAQNQFPFHPGAAWAAEWSGADTLAARAAWDRYVKAKRSGEAPKRLVPDAPIGAVASRFDGLLARNKGDFRRLFQWFAIFQTVFTRR